MSNDKTRLVHRISNERLLPLTILHLHKVWSAWSVTKIFRDLARFIEYPLTKFRLNSAQFRGCRFVKSIYPSLSNFAVFQYRNRAIIIEIHLSFSINPDRVDRSGQTFEQNFRDFPFASIERKMKSK